LIFWGTGGSNSFGMTVSNISMTLVKKYISPAEIARRKREKERKEREIRERLERERKKREEKR